MPSKLEQLQLKFRQRLMQEKEERMIKIHTDSQQKALSKVNRYDSNYHVPAPVPVSKKSPGVHTNQTHQSPVKKGSPGVDRSRPLPPISKEQKNSYNRVSPASTPSESTGKALVPNGVRPKSVDSDVKHSSSKTSYPAKTKHRTDLYHSPDMESQQNLYSDSENKLSSVDYLTKLKQAELQRIRMNGKVNGDSTPKQSDGHFATGNNGHSKSSIERRGSPVGNRPTPLVSSVSKPKPMTQASTSVRRSPATPSAKNTCGTPPARKAPSASQEQCRHCGRNFNKDRIEKHVAICARTSQKRRKVFDVTKMRVRGTEAETYVKKGAPAAPPPKQSKKTNWKKQHEEFIATIRQAKVMQRHLAAGGKVSDLPPPPPSDTSHYIPCPHCHRKFNEGVAERHIPKCKNIFSNKKPPPRRK